jgi:hypothetical protein
MAPAMVNLMLAVVNHKRGKPYLDIFIIFIRNHYFYYELLNMGSNGLLADVLNKLTKLHGQPLFALCGPA